MQYSSVKDIIENPKVKKELEQTLAMTASRVRQKGLTEIQRLNGALQAKETTKQDVGRAIEIEAGQYEKQLEEETQPEINKIIAAWRAAHPDDTTERVARVKQHYQKELLEPASARVKIAEQELKVALIKEVRETLADIDDNDLGAVVNYLIGKIQFVENFNKMLLEKKTEIENPTMPAPVATQLTPQPTQKDDSALKEKMETIEQTLNQMSVQQKRLAEENEKAKATAKLLEEKENVLSEKDKELEKVREELRLKTEEAEQANAALDFYSDLIDPATGEIKSDEPQEEPADVSQKTQEGESEAGGLNFDDSELTDDEKEALEETDDKQLEVAIESSTQEEKQSDLELDDEPVAEVKESNVQEVSKKNSNFWVRLTHRMAKW